jgi:ABC-type glycerol-3-phosphate transport system substrate-binding protein
MKGMSPFQTVLLGVFGLFLLVGVALFATGGRLNQKERVDITVWGPISNLEFGSLWEKLPQSKDDTYRINYVRVPPQDFDTQFVEALASRKGPDIVFIDQQNLIKHRDKLVVIPFQSYPERTFRDTFVEHSELFLSEEGILAFPIALDPLVMFWNRDILFSEGIANPPSFWDEFFTLSSRLTRKDGALNVSRPTVALGEIGNVANGKHILAAMMIQAGSPISTQRNGAYRSALSETISSIQNPATAALSYFVDFVNPTKAHYTWNRSLPSSQTMFLGNDLALYFGFGSELPLLKEKNPNLNFDVAALPQTRGAARQTAYGVAYGLAITKDAKNVTAAFAALSGLVSRQSTIDISRAMSMVSMRKDAVSDRNEDKFQTILNQSAVRSRGWLEPGGRTAGERIFTDMVESVTGGRSTPSEAVSRASTELNRAFEE